MTPEPTFGEVYAALVRVLGPAAEVSPGCVAWPALDRAGAGLTLQLIGPVPALEMPRRALVLSVVEPSTPRAHAHWTLAGPWTASAPFLYPDEAIPKAVQWLTARGVAMPSGGPPAPTTPDVPRCGGERGFSRCAYAKGHPGPCSFQHADYLGGYDR